MGGVPNIKESLVALRNSLMFQAKQVSLAVGQDFHMSDSSVP